MCWCCARAGSWGQARPGAVTDVPFRAAATNVAGEYRIGFSKRPGSLNPLTPAQDCNFEQRLRLAERRCGVPTDLGPPCSMRVRHQAAVPSRNRETRDRHLWAIGHRASGIRHHGVTRSTLNSTCKCAGCPDDRLTAGALLSGEAATCVESRSHLPSRSAMSTWDNLRPLCSTSSPEILNQVTKRRLLQPSDGLFSVKCSQTGRIPAWLSTVWYLRCQTHLLYLWPHERRGRGRGAWAPVFAPAKPSLRAVP